MRTSYEEELKALGVRLSRMGGLAEEQLAHALEALNRRIPALAAAVVDGDETLDVFEQSIDDDAVRILALRHPMAVDLREVVATIKIASTLERIGDLAKNIARRAQTIAALTADAPQRPSGPVVNMGKLARDQLADALDALAARDADAALRVWMRDIELDELYNALSRVLIADMRENPDSVELNVHTLFVAKNLERIGDHATFLSEMTYFITTGGPMPGDRPKGPPDGSAVAEDLRRPAP